MSFAVALLGDLTLLNSFSLQKAAQLADSLAGSAGLSPDTTSVKAPVYQIRQTLSLSVRGAGALRTPGGGRRAPRDLPTASVSRSEGPRCVCPLRARSRRARSGQGMWLPSSSASASSWCGKKSRPRAAYAPSVGDSPHASS